MGKRKKRKGVGRGKRWKRGAKKRRKEGEWRKEGKIINLGLASERETSISRAPGFEIENQPLTSKQTSMIKLSGDFHSLHFFFFFVVL